MAAARPAGSTVTKIDPGTGKAVGSPFGVGAGAVPTGIAVGGGSVWVAVNRGRSLEVVELGPEVGEPRNEGSSSDHGFVWLGGQTGVTRLDPAPGRRGRFHWP
jgi:streptogramin lyase